MTSLVERVAELLKVVTPGPWTVVPHGDGDSLVICDDEFGMWRICFMSTPGSEGSWDTIKANASLIALSKTMAEALVRQAEALEAAEIALRNRDQSELDAVALRAVKRALAALSPSNTKPGADDE